VPQSWTPQVHIGSRIALYNIYFTIYFRSIAASSQYILLEFQVVFAWWLCAFSSLVYDRDVVLNILRRRLEGFSDCLRLLADVFLCGECHLYRFCSICNLQYFFRNIKVKSYFGFNVRIIIPSFAVGSTCLPRCWKGRKREMFASKDTPDTFISDRTRNARWKTKVLNRRSLFPAGRRCRELQLMEIAFDDKRPLEWPSAIG